MIKYYQLTRDADYTKGQAVKDYEFGEFDPFNLCKGEPFHGKIPDNVKLFLHKEWESLEVPNVLPNHLWLIFSEWLLQLWLPYIKDDVQIFDAPVYRESDGIRVNDYKLINPIRVLPCIDMERSEVGRRADGSISCFGKIYIKDAAVGDHYIFRPKEKIHAVIVKAEIAHLLKGKGFKGIAFIKCGSS